MVEKVVEATEEPPPAPTEFLLSRPQELIARLSASVSSDEMATATQDFHNMTVDAATQTVEQEGEGNLTRGRKCVTLALVLKEQRMCRKGNSGMVPRAGSCSSKRKKIRGRRVRRHSFQFARKTQAVQFQPSSLLLPNFSVSKELENALDSRCMCRLAQHHAAHLVFSTLF